MTIEQALFLGVVQGLTEFFPVSSSGHLVFFQSLFGLKDPPIFFDVLLHLGTLLAVVVFFRDDILKILEAVKEGLTGKKESSSGRKLLIWIIVSSIPTGIMGFLFKDWFESVFASPKLVGGMLLVTGMVLWLTRFVRGKERGAGKMNWKDALLIGIGQGVAIIPGISRSGATISTGLFCGLDRELSGKFSFLLSIPAILGATVLEFRKIESSSEIVISLLGTGAAFCVGLLALRLLMPVIRQGQLFRFAYYCWAVGLVMIIVAG